MGDILVIIFENIPCNFMHFLGTVLSDQISVDRSPGLTIILHCSVLHTPCKRSNKEKMISSKFIGNCQILCYYYNIYM